MKEEQSYGAVVFKDGKVVVEFMKLGHVSIPKGHVEVVDNGIPLNTVKREIKEELNIEIDVDMGYQYKTSYYPEKDVLKHVTFFVAKYKSGEFKPQETEIEHIELHDVDKAIELMTYQSDKEAILGAYNYINNKK